jgi:hypothetical protein
VELSEDHTADRSLTTEGEPHVSDPADVNCVAGIDEIPEMRVDGVEQGLPDAGGSHEPLYILSHAVGAHEPGDTHGLVLRVRAAAKDAGDSLLIDPDHADRGVAKGVDKCLLRAFTEGGEDFTMVRYAKVWGEFEEVTLCSFADFQSSFP